MHNCLRPFFRGDREQLGRLHQALEDASAMIAKPGRHESGMQAVRRDSGLAPSLRKLPREKYVAQFRATVDGETPVPLCRLQVVKIEPGAFVRSGGGRPVPASLRNRTCDSLQTSSPIHRPLPGAN